MARRRTDRAGSAPQDRAAHGPYLGLGADGAIARLADLGIARKLFVHINNSNPLLRPHSAERAEAEAAGWRVPRAGEEISP
ncbi:coenzyme PQQ synthesis protein B [Limimaricola cinnabarinus LL-001]|uniref:Coenzyme PQQ synthesis protein B n=1 Tax=Limimaricola cinnabarinus LL-001 TaxID=1337093 RepID=U3AGN5_9RHOB|nr:coenzyme PQQ synthesis protein B [Limimaricola cinnabarinus LL-001]